MKNPVTWSIIINIILMFIILGLASSWAVVGYILLGLFSLRMLSVPTVAFAFLFRKYKQLRGSYQIIFAFLMSIQQQLKTVDQMQITDLRIVHLKQKIKLVRQTLRRQKKRRQENAKG